MKRLSILAFALVAASVALPVATAFGQQAPAPVTILEKRFLAAPPSGPYDMVLLVLDLEPGTQFPSHAHGGPVFVTVAEGAMRDRSGGQETVLRTGDTLAEATGRVHEAGNDGPGMARLIVTVLLPTGATLTTDTQTGVSQELPPGATVVAQATLPTPRESGPLEVIQRLVELPPGAVGLPHTHPGPNLNVVLQGQFALNMEGRTQAFTSNDSWVEPANVVHGGSNTGSTTTRIVANALVPLGAAFATPAQQTGAQPPPSAKPAIAPAQVPAR
jgi:quercetin dioxygenase-like cupin family protein